jgi:hypothetical protein
MWSRRKFGGAADTLKKKKEQLLSLQRSASPALAGAIKTLQAEIEEISEREDMRRKQRSKQKWYQHGDRNTQYFYSWANQRRKTNTIRSITVDAGRVWKKKQEVSKQFLDYYEHLFSSQGLTWIDQW